MNICALRNRSTHTDPIIDRYFDKSEMLSMIGICDFVLAATPLTPETHHMISDAAFAAMDFAARQEVRKLLDLLAIAPLRDLLTVDQDKKVRDFMTENPVAVSTLATEEEITDVIAKYNLLALPVVDAEGRMIGVAFDGNQASFAGAFAYDGSANRTVVVSAAASSTGCASRASGSSRSTPERDPRQRTARGSSGSSAAGVRHGGR